MLDIVLAPPPGDLPQPAGLIVTSRNGVRALADMAAGGRLARRAAVCGRRGDGGGGAGGRLHQGVGRRGRGTRRSSRLIARAPAAGQGPVIYAAARDLSGGLAEQLEEAGYDLQMVEAYRAERADEPQPGGHGGAGGGNHRRGAVLFAADGRDLPRSRRRPRRCGWRTSSPCRRMSPAPSRASRKTLHVAAEPNEASLFALIPPR